MRGSPRKRQSLLAGAIAVAKTKRQLDLVSLSRSFCSSWRSEGTAWCRVRKACGRSPWEPSPARVMDPLFKALHRSPGNIRFAQVGDRFAEKLVLVRAGACLARSSPRSGRRNTGRPSDWRRSGAAQGSARSPVLREACAFPRTARAGRGTPRDRRDPSRRPAGS